jgi:hypothetical protein
MLRLATSILAAVAISAAIAGPVPASAGSTSDSPSSTDSSVPLSAREIALAAWEEDADGAGAVAVYPDLASDQMVA